MLNRLADRLGAAGLWQIVGLSIIASEVLTALMNVILSYIWWGEFSTDLFLIGSIDALVVCGMVAPIIVLIVYRLRDKVEIEIRNMNEKLERRVEERTAELRASEEKYRLLMEQASDGIVIIGQDLNLIAANPRSCEMFGYTREELLTLTVKDLYRPEDLPGLSASLEELRSGKTLIRERLLRRKDGSLIPVEVSAKFLDDGRLQAFVRDITERRRAEEEKERMHAELVKAKKMEAIGTLAGGIAHDFNNLLTVIKGDCALALTDIDEDDTAHLHLKQIQRAAGRAADLTRKLLLFSRQKSMSPVYLGLNKSVDDMFKMLKRLIGEDITINIDAGPALMSIFADPISVEQVIMNLAVNARDAMQGGGRLTIKTRNVVLDEEHCMTIPKARPGRFVCLSVTDSGIGMDSETVQHIFDPFYSARDGGKGTGLGLSVVYGIVEQHGGYITVQSEPGKGSTFSIYFEGFDVRPDDEIMWSFPADRALGKTPDAPHGKGERILLIEDEEGVSALVERTLTNNGYAVFPAFDSEEAMEIFEREGGNFHLVFSDVVLPGESGIQLVERLLEKKPGLPVLISSGYTDQKSQWPAIREKGYQFLEKPYELPDLLRAIRTALSASRLSTGVIQAP
jgi:two-component system cell cycle sensor histidine kinase/response regulator CckA